MVVGEVADKLSQIRTYDRDKPFQIGVNGVTNIVYYNPTTNNNFYNLSSSAITKIEYTIDSVNYRTFFDPPFQDLSNPGVAIRTEFYTYYSGYNFEPEILPPNLQNTFDIKEENKMGMISPPKVVNDLFIERGNTAVFERYSRLSEINGLGPLEYYRNGYYNLVKNR